MKSKIITACIAATLVITFISCDLFRSRRIQEFNLQGQWKVDSVENKGSDSSNNIGLLAFAMAAKDSSPVGIQFNSDSSYQYLNAPDSTKGQYYISGDKNSLFIKEDSVFNQLNFLTKADTAFSVATTDSIVIYFKKK